MTDKKREEGIEEKAELLLDEIVDNPNPAKTDMENAKDFIRTIYKEIEDKFWAREQYHLDTIKELKKQLDEKKPKVSREFVKRWWRKPKPGAWLTLQELKEMLKEAGVEVEE